jgi:hypothetical protein
LVSSLNKYSFSDFFLDSLSVTKEGLVFETQTGTQEQLDKACLLAAYPENDRPIIVTAQGEVLLTVGEYKAEHDPTTSHKKLMDSAAMDFGSDNGGDANEKTTSPLALEVVLHPLKFAHGRGSIVLDSKDTDKEVQPKKGKKGKKKYDSDIPHDSSSESASASASNSESESEPQRTSKQKPAKSKSKTKSRKIEKTMTLHEPKKRSREDAKHDSELDAADDENEPSTSAKKPRHK